MEITILFWAALFLTGSLLASIASARVHRLGERSGMLTSKVSMNKPTLGGGNVNGTELAEVTNRTR